MGFVCILLGAHLVRQYRALAPHSYSHAQPPASRRVSQAGKESRRASDELAQFDPSLHLETLNGLDSRPLPREGRNPFAFVEPPPPPAAKQAALAPAPAPPAPPPVPLKPMGYNELPGGKKEAIVTYNDDVQVVHEGDVVASRFKIVRITPTELVVEDGETHQTLEMPFPQ